MLSKLIKIGVAAGAVIGMGIVAETALLIKQKNDADKAIDNLSDIIEDQQNEIEQLKKENVHLKNQTASKSCSCSHHECSSEKKAEQADTDEQTGFEHKKMTKEELLNQVTEVATEVVTSVHHMIDSAINSDKAASIKDEFSKAITHISENDTVKKALNHKVVTDFKGMAKDAHDKLHDALVDLTKAAEELTKEQEKSENSDNNQDTPGK